MAGAGDEPTESGDEAQRAALVAAARERFLALARRPEAEVDLAEGALLIAAEEYPGLDVPAHLQKLESLAARVRQRLAASALAAGPPDPDEAALSALHAVLFDEEGFAGAEPADYAHPRNSFLNEVLERKRGLPITLSVVYCEVARRAGLDAVGINLPGHFLAQFRGQHLSVLVDPYRHGARLQEGNREALARQVFGQLVEISDEHLLPASRKQILARMLNNLKLFYLQARPPQFAKALAAVERILAINPSIDQVRDRGLILRAMGLQALTQAAAVRAVDPLDHALAMQAVERAVQLLGPAWFDLRLHARLAEGAPDAQQIADTADQIWKLLGRHN